MLGLLTTIGLAAQNANLIVESARGLEQTGTPLLAVVRAAAD